MDEESEIWRAEFSEAYLRPLREEGRTLRRKLAELAEQREIMSGLRGVSFDKPVIAGAPAGDGVAEAVARLMDMENDYRADLVDLDRKRAEARGLLGQMGGTDADILRLYYVSALPWVCVGDAVNLAEGTCRNMRRPALARFYDFLPHYSKPPRRAAVPHLRSEPPRLEKS